MSEKILVVEDSRAFRNYLYQQLKNSGYEVALAESIEEAKAILEQETDFLCAVLDYCLPDGQDGEIIDFYKWEGDVKALLGETRGKIDTVALSWNDVEKNECIDEVRSTFVYSKKLMSNL